MRIVVTGGMGFIGSAVIRLVMSTTDHEILNVDKRTYAAVGDTLGAIRSNGRYSEAITDVADSAELLRLFNDFKPDAILHLAAETHVDRSIVGPEPFIRSNVLGTFGVLEAALSYWRNLGADARELFRLVHVSTDEVFGSLDFGDPPSTQNSPYLPRSPYSASKASSDHLVRAWGHTYGLPTMVTNCSNNYGPFQFPEKLIPLLVVKSLAGEPLPVYGDGRNIRDWLFVEDHARGLLATVERGVPNETYLFGGNTERRNIDVVQAVCDRVDERAGLLSVGPRRRLIQYVQDRAGHDFRYAIDSRRTRSLLRWEPTVDFESGLASTIDWYIDNDWWWAPIVADGVHEFSIDGGADK